MRRFAVQLGLALVMAAQLVAFTATPAQAGAGNLMTWFNTGCAVGRSVIHGCLLSSARGPIAPGGSSEPATKEGRACGWNVLMLFAWGDLRISTAMESAGITQLSAVDSYAFELIPGFYGINHYCTVVSGS
jgi:hypothetical protein